MRKFLLALGVLLAAFVLSDTGRNLLDLYNLLYNKSPVVYYREGDIPQLAELGPNTKIPDWVPLPANTKIETASHFLPTVHSVEKGSVHVRSDLSPEQLNADYKTQLKQLGYEIVRVENHRGEAAGAKYIFHAFDREGKRSLGVMVFTDIDPSRGQITYSYDIVEPLAINGITLVREE